MMLTSLANYNDSDRRDVIINFDRISSGVITRTRSVWIPWIIACYRACLYLLITMSCRHTADQHVVT